jgi:SAM-dependent methyltransferase
VVFGTKPEYYWVSLLLFLGIVLVVILCWKRVDFRKEGFQQEQPYLYVSAVYSDPLYISMYDRLMLPRDILENITTQVVEMTQPSIHKSTMLDLGSGTGTLAAKLAKKGFTVYGVDQSHEMIESSNKKYGDIPTLQLKEGDVMEPLLWESGSFSHILCTGFTLYLMKDNESKRRLMENAFHWLRPGGYLVVQLVDPDKFQTIIPGGRPPIPLPPSPDRVVNTVIDFVDFEYKASFKVAADSNNKNMHLHESFVDGLTKHVRELEQTFSMLSVRDVLTMAVQSGFQGQGYVEMKHDPHQYLYVFVKPA